MLVPMQKLANYNTMVCVCVCVLPWGGFVNVIVLKDKEKKNGPMTIFNSFQKLVPN